MDLLVVAAIITGALTVIVTLLAQHFGVWQPAGTPRGHPTRLSE
jgi:hypothetical protein